MILSVKKLKASKEHVCCICGLTIPIGKIYYREAGTESTFFDHCFCRPCYIARAVHLDAGGEGLRIEDVSHSIREAVCHGCRQFCDKSPLLCAKARKKLLEGYDHD